MFQRDEPPRPKIDHEVIIGWIVAALAIIVISWAVSTVSKALAGDRVTTVPIHHQVRITGCKAEDSCRINYTANGVWKITKGGVR